MVNRLYFVSCGPGDPGLLTLAGLKAIEESPFILSPALYMETFAQLLEGKEVESPFTMNFADASRWIEARLQKGSVAFLVPGDFSTFSPFQSFITRFSDISEVIPGVGAHSAAAAVLKRAFDMPRVAHCTVVTSPRAITQSGRVDLREYGGPGKTLILYMVNKKIDELVADLLAVYPPHTPIAILEKIACPDQIVAKGTLSTIADILGDRDPFNVGSASSEPSLALVVVGDAIGADEPPESWDYRYENLWKPRAMR